MKYLVNETTVCNTKVEAFRQARNLASVVYEAKLRIGIPKQQAKEESRISVVPITDEEAESID